MITGLQSGSTPRDVLSMEPEDMEALFALRNSVVHTTPSLVQEVSKIRLFQTCHTGLRTIENLEPTRVLKPVVRELELTSADHWVL